MDFLKEPNSYLNPANGHVVRDVVGLIANYISTVPCYSCHRYIDAGYSICDKMKTTDERMSLVAVQCNGMNLQRVKRTPEICLAAVQQNSHALIFVREETPEICMAAVKQNGYGLMYVQSQTPEICLVAVKQNGDALKFVKNQTPEICLEAIKQNDKAREWVTISLDD